MSFDRKSPDTGAAQVHGHGHKHAIPHSHGNTVQRATAGTAPGMSLLRLSILARLASAIVGAGLIWFAVRWAIA